MSSYVNARVFRGVTSSTSYADRVVEGRARLVGFLFTPRFEVENSVSDNRNTVDLHDVNESLDGKTGSALIKIPIWFTKNYISIANCSFSEEDGGILFERGIYVDEENDDGDDALVSFDLTLFYVGGKVYDNARP
jgi:hypothetical protein